MQAQVKEWGIRLGRACRKRGMVMAHLRQGDILKIEKSHEAFRLRL